MNRKIIGSMVVLMMGLIAVAATGSAGDPPSSGPILDVSCSPVGVTWPASPSGTSKIEGPQMSVVRTEFNPKSARLFLDGRFIGRAHYFKGKKGFLYLLPGNYRLEAVKEGYRTEVFSIQARPNCRFDITQKMQKARGAGFEYAGVPSGKGKPIQWIYGPVNQPMPAPTGGPDPSLRRDLQ